MERMEAIMRATIGMLGNEREVSTIAISCNLQKLGVVRRLTGAIICLIASSESRYKKRSKDSATIMSGASRKVMAMNLMACFQYLFMAKFAIDLFYPQHCFP